MPKRAKRNRNPESHQHEAFLTDCQNFNQNCDFNRNQINFEQIDQSSCSNLIPNTYDHPHIGYQSVDSENSLFTCHHNLVEKFVLRLTNLFSPKSNNSAQQMDKQDPVQNLTELRENCPLLTQNFVSRNHQTFSPHNPSSSLDENKHHKNTNNNNHNVRINEDPSVHDSTHQFESAEVEDWMRRRLYYYFMNPIGKFQAKRRIPFKLFIQLLKIIVVTLQLIQFGYNRAAHLSFGDASHRAFSHLYLANWDAQYETLDYPPATGPYAVYTIEHFYEYIGFTISQFNQTNKLSLGSYLFTSDSPTMTLCLRNLSFDYSHSSSEFEIQSCITIQPSIIPYEQINQPKLVKQFLDSLNLTIKFSRLLGFDILFTLLSPPVSQLGWTHDFECYRFQIKISFENPSQSGQIKIILTAPYTTAPCKDVNKSNNSIINWDISTFWSKLLTGQFNDSQNVNLFSVRRILIVLVNLLSFILGLISLILCIRSLTQGFRMWIETRRFFANWFGIELNGVFWEFVRPWLLFILTNDVLIITTSLYALITLDNIQEKYEPLSYLMGMGILLVWIGILYYIGFSYDNSLLIRTISRSIPGLLRFCACSLVLFFAFSLCGWIVLGPYNLKFRSFISTLECLFSLINGDDMFVTFSIINERKPIGIYIFSRLFLYVFITLFIYVVLNLFVTIIFEAYEEVKDMQHTCGRPNDSPLWHFVLQHHYSPKSPIFRIDEIRPDRHILQEQAQGTHLTTMSSTANVITALLKFKSKFTTNKNIDNLKISQPYNSVNDNNNSNDNNTNTTTNSTTTTTISTATSNKYNSNILTTNTTSNNPSSSTVSVISPHFSSSSSVESHNQSDRNLNNQSSMLNNNNNNNQIQNSNYLSLNNLDINIVNHTQPEL